MPASRKHRPLPVEVLELDQNFTQKKLIKAFKEKYEAEELITILSSWKRRFAITHQLNRLCV